MKRALLASVAAIALASPALAADIPPAAPPVYRAPVVAPPVLYNWTGVYIGVNGGYGWARPKYDAAGFATVSGDSRGGSLGGGQIGFNYQMGMFVLGAELDGQWANIRRTTNSVFGQGRDITDNITAFMTGRGRLGVAFDNFLLYATGGGVWLWSKTTYSGNAQNAFPTLEISGSRGGWTVGGGGEVGWGPWSMRAEYLYIRTVKRTDNYQATDISSYYDAHVARFAVNYRWGPTVSARY